MYEEWRSGGVSGLETRGSKFGSSPRHELTGIVTPTQFNDQCSLQLSWLSFTCGFCVECGEIPRYYFY